MAESGQLSTLDSLGPMISNNYSFNLATKDDTGADAIEFQPAGSRVGRATGQFAFSWQAAPEAHPQGFVWSNTFTTGPWPSGWWAWTIGPEFVSYDSLHVALAVSGETAAPLREQERGWAEILIPNQTYNLDPPETHNAGFYIGDRNAPNRFQLGNTPPTIGDGTWLPGDRIWNVSPAFNGPTGWVCIETGPPDLWIPIPLTGDAQITIDMANANVDLSVDPVAAANRMILLTDGANMTDRDLTMPAPADDEHAYRRVIRNATLHDVYVGIGAGTIKVDTNTVRDVGFDAGGAFFIN